MRLMFYFFKAYPKQTSTMLLSLLVAGVVEGFSLTALLPVLNIAIGNGTAKGHSGTGRMATTALDFIGITPTVPITAYTCACMRYPEKSPCPHSGQNGRLYGSSCGD